MAPLILAILFLLQHGYSLKNINIVIIIKYYLLKLELLGAMAPLILAIGWPAAEKIPTFEGVCFLKGFFAPYSCFGFLEHI